MPTITQKSKTMVELPNSDIDYVITLCDHAHKTCPFWPGKAKVIHVGFEDPIKLAAMAKSEEEALAYFRRVRDEIRHFVMTLPDCLNNNQDS